MKPNRFRNAARSMAPVIALTTAGVAYAQKDWPTFGHDLAGTRYSTLKQIDAWHTQPIPLKPPVLARTSFKREEIATVTPELNKFCTELFDSIPGGLHVEGPFTHYSTTPSVIFPSSIGGGNWNPPSFDPNLGYLFVNTMDFGSLNTMVKSADGTRYSRSGYNGINRFWEPESNMPRNQPPWGRLFAINVNTGDIVAGHARHYRQFATRQAETRAAEHRWFAGYCRWIGIHRRHRRQPLSGFRIEDGEGSVDGANRCRSASRRRSLFGVKTADSTSWSPLRAADSWAIRAGAMR